MSTGYNPLNQKHCDVCSEILNTIGEPIEIAKKCIECGFPADELLQELLRQQKQAADIKRTFFPHNP